MARMEQSEAVVAHNSHMTWSHGMLSHT